MTTTVRVVQAGWPLAVYVSVDRPRSKGERPEREILSDDVPSIDEGMRLAEAKLLERGQRVGPWTPIGPCVREAPVLGGAPCPA